MIERSNFRDSQIMKKEKQRKEEDEAYEALKEKKEKEKALDLAKIKAKQKSLTKKKCPTKTKTNGITTYPAHIKPVPDNIKHLSNIDDLMFCVDPDGACGPNSTAAHIFEDPVEGKKLREVINTHISEHFSYYQPKIDFPYKRQVGNKGENVTFNNPD